MRVLLLAPQPFYQERGTPIAGDLLLRTLSARGDEVDVLTYHEGATVRYPGVRLYRIPRIPFVHDVRPGPSIKKLVCDLVFFVQALRLGRRGRYDVVHAIEESVFTAMVMKRLYGTPYLYDMDSHLAGQLMAKFVLLRPLAPVLRWAEWLAIRHAEAIVPMCDALAEVAAVHRPKRVVVLRDVSLLTINGRTASSSGPIEGVHTSGPVAMYIGNLERYQGIELLLESFAVARRSVPSAQLVIVGGHPHHIDHYQRMADRLGIADATRFLGPRPVAHLPRCFSTADVLVSPRIHGANTPMKIYSYLDSGKSVLATRLATHTQVLTDEVAMLRPPTPDAFGDGLACLLQNPALRTRLGGAGRALVAKRHSYQVYQDTVNELYGTLGRVDTSSLPPAPRGSAAYSASSATAKSRLSWFRIAVSMGAVLWLVRTLEWGPVTALAQNLSVGWMVPALGLTVAVRLLTTWKWNVLLQAKRLAFRFRDLLRLVCIGNFLNNFLPSTVGADNVRMVALARGSSRAPEIVSTVIMERITGVVSLVGLALLGGIWSYGRWGEPKIMLSLMLPVSVMLIVLGLVWTRLGHRILTSLLDRLSRVPGRAFLAELLTAIRSYDQQPRPVLRALAISGLTQLARVATVYFLARALGVTLFFGGALVLVPSILFIAMLPISVARLGVQEGAFVVFLGLAGVEPGAAFGVSILSRLVILVADLPGLGMFLARGLSAHQLPRAMSANEEYA